MIICHKKVKNPSLNGIARKEKPFSSTSILKYSVELFHLQFIQAFKTIFFTIVVLKGTLAFILRYATPYA